MKRIAMGLLYFPPWFLIVNFILAPLSLFWTFVKEGSVAIITKGDGFAKILLKWEGYTLDKDGNIIPAKAENSPPKSGPWVKDGRVLEQGAWWSGESNGERKIGQINSVTLRADSIKKAKIKDGRVVVIANADVLISVFAEPSGETVGIAKLTEEEVKLDDIEVESYPDFKYSFGGLMFFGLWPLYKRYMYQFSWTSVAQNGELAHHAAVLLDYVLTKDDVYYAKVEDSEDQDLLNLTIDLLITARVVNPSKAIFQIQDWLETVLNRIKPLFREYVAQSTFEKLIAQKQDMGSLMWYKLQRSGIMDEFFDRYGIEVRAIEIKSINPPDGYRATTLAKRTAELEAAGVKARYSMIKEFGSLGELLQVLEAIKEGPQAGSKWVVPLPGFSTLMENVFSKSVGELNNDDIALLRQVAEEKREQNNTEAEK